MILSDSFNKPVLISQVLEALKVEKGKKYIDATIGGGGYAEKILIRGGGIEIDQIKMQ
jgi:16S rRNA C1402 N4-methylase RsmH